MRQHGLKSKVTAKWKPYPAESSYVKQENLITRDWQTSDINQVWFTDITYVKTVKDNWTYLASVIDMHSRRIVGYAYGFHKDTTLTLMALSNALLSRDVRPGETILHSDNGSEFTSEDYEAVAKAYQLKRSYSAPGVPYDQAIIESFHATLKKEEVHPNVYESFEEARVRLIYWIEHWYNRTRFHSSLDYLSPVEYEKQLVRDKEVEIPKR